MVTQNGYSGVAWSNVKPLSLVRQGEKLIDKRVRPCSTPMGPLMHTSPSLHLYYDLANVASLQHSVNGIRDGGHTTVCVQGMRVHPGLELAL